MARNFPKEWQKWRSTYISRFKGDGKVGNLKQTWGVSLEQLDQ